MKWESITKDLSRLCMLLSHDDDTRIGNREWGTVEGQFYSRHPDHSANVIQNYTKPGRADSKSQKGFGSGRHRTITSSVRRQRKMAQKRHENWPPPPLAWACHGLVEAKARGCHGYPAWGRNRGAAGSWASHGFATLRAPAGARAYTNCIHVAKD